MAIINPDGLFGGERLAQCSDEAQLHWVRLFTASNTFGRLELSYMNIIRAAYQSFHVKPTEEQIRGWIQEFRSNFLLFIYEAHDGSIWGQWLTSSEFLSRYHTAADRRSPTPPENNLEEYRQNYITSKKSKSLIMNNVSIPQQTSFVHTLGIGIGIGIGEGKGEEQNPASVQKKKRGRPPKNPEEFTLLTHYRHDFEAYFRHKNNVDAPWDGTEAAQLSRWMKANPTINREQWQQILRNRAKSPVVHTTPLRKWIGNALSWLNGLADDFGRNLNGGFNGRPTAQSKQDATIAAGNELISRIRGVDNGRTDQDSDFNGGTGQHSPLSLDG